ncbi:MAG: polyprenyl diphosphate synthase, partial [Butyrivibrio sp.]
REITEYCNKLGIKYLTVYVFSTENWSRSKSEVDGLMKILRNYLKDCIKRANKNNMKVRIIGKTDRLDDDIIQRISDLEEATKDNTGLVFQVALNYGGRDEMVRAMRKMTKDIIEKGLDPDSIDEAMFSSYLDTAGIPDPDLIIRTSGEKRISNFLLWQCAYSEFDFPDVLWPEFNKDRLIEAVERYNKRERRFGGVKEE